MPARVVPDPIRGVDAYLVLCEVLNPADNTPHATNTRAKLAHLMESAASEEPWIGIEQEYTMFKGSSPLGFPAERRFPDLKALTTAVSALTKYSVAKSLKTTSMVSKLACNLRYQRRSYAWSVGIPNRWP